MRPRVLISFIVLSASVLLSGPIHADFRAGMNAYSQGDYATALKEWRPLAEHGDAGAQYILGVLYATGQGVPQDDVQAHMWVSLADAQGYKLARRARDELARRMTPAQITEAQRLAREWKPKPSQ